MQTIDVLLVEPEVADAQRVCECLSNHSLATFVVAQVATMEAAINALQTRQFDVVLIDYDVSPAIGGTDPISLIHRVAPRIAVVVLSAHDDDALSIEAVARRAQDFLAKTHLAPQILGRTILHAIQRQQSEENAKQMQRRLMHADRLAAIGVLAAGVAHEVNNPAAVVMANLSVMREHLTKLIRFDRALRDQAEMERGAVGMSALGSLIERHDIEVLLTDADDIVRDSLEGMRRIAAIVRDLRTFSRIEREEVEQLTINEVVNAACNIAYNQLRHRAQLVKDLGDVPAIAADRGKLTQAVVNLLLNAAQAITEGSAEAHQIRVHTRAERERVVISVTDTGVGIPDDIRDRIFEPFFSTKPREQGSGLGLSLCAEIVRQHSGWIQVTSTLGKGSRFDVLLPMDTGLVPNRNRAAVAEEAPVAPVRSRRVLIVDDETFVLRAFRRTLAPPNDVVVAEGGGEAIEILKGDVDFDAIVCDLMMPQVDGVMLYNFIRDHAPSLLNRIVFCSGGAFTERAKEFVAAMPNLILEKPVSADELRQAIERVATKPAEATHDLLLTGDDPQ